MQSRLWMPAYVGLGSNLDNPVAQVHAALDALTQLQGSRLVVHSSLYRSPPLGPRDQPDFVNAVAGLLTTLEPRSLLRQLKSLERELGRELPVHRWGPRRIDLDLLLVGDEASQDPEFTLPHPGIGVRSFVLYPLREIAADVEIPGLGRVLDLAGRVDPGGIVPLMADLV